MFKNLIRSFRGGPAGTKWTPLNPSNPDLSVVVVMYNIAREAARTIHSLSRQYQRFIDVEDYEVIIVDNGSNPPLAVELAEPLPSNFRLIRIDEASPSPAAAV